MDLDQDDETILSNVGEMDDIVTYFDAIDGIDANDPVFRSIKKQIDDAEIVISRGLLETKLEDTESNLEKVLGNLKSQNIKIEEFETHLSSKDDLISSLTLERDMLTLEREELKHEVSSLQLKSSRSNCGVPSVFHHKEATRIRQPGSNVCIHSIKVDDNEVIAYKSLLSPLQEDVSEIKDQGTEIILLDRDVQPLEDSKDGKKKDCVNIEIAGVAKIIQKISFIKCFSSQSCKVLIKPLSRENEIMGRKFFKARKGKRFKYYPVPPDTFQDSDFKGGCSNDPMYYLRDLSKQYREGKHTDEWLIKKLCTFDEANRARLEGLHQKMTLQHLRIAGLNRELQCTSLFSSSCPSMIQSESFSSLSNSSFSSKSR